MVRQHTIRTRRGGDDDIRRHNEGTGDQGPWDVFPKDHLGADAAANAADPAKPAETRGARPKRGRT